MYYHIKATEKESFITNLGWILINYVHQNHHQPTNRAELAFTLVLKSG